MNFPLSTEIWSKRREIRTHFLVACGRSSSSCVLVCTVSVCPLGSVTLPLPLRLAGMITRFFCRLFGVPKGLKELGEGRERARVRNGEATCGYRVVGVMPRGRLGEISNGILRARLLCGTRELSGCFFFAKDKLL